MLVYNDLFKDFKTELVGLRPDGRLSVKVCQETVCCYFVLLLSWGLTIAGLKSGGTTPETREVLMMWVIVERTSRFAYSNFAGIGSTLGIISEPWT